MAALFTERSRWLYCLHVEARVHHDVVAFVTAVAAELGKEGRWVHFGLTSSDVLDTGLALQLRDAGGVILSELDRLTAALEKRAHEIADLACIGRTHGMHAEPTIFGLKSLGFFGGNAPESPAASAGV
jgi:adenylosuccinate lyase